jgi:hypothetical protein
MKISFLDRIVTKFYFLILNPFSLLFEYIYRFPDKKYVKNFSKLTIKKNNFNNHNNEFLIEDLKKNGITHLKSFLNDKKIKILKLNFDSAMYEIEHSTSSNLKFTPKSHFSIKVPYLEDEYLEDTKHFHTRNILKFNKIFLELVCSDLLIEIATQYFQKEIFLNQIDSYRLCPIAKSKYSSFQWHHDGQGKKLNMMVLLTDVDCGGQKMTYLKGSHLKYRSFKECLNSRVSETEVNQIYSNSTFNHIFECIGKAGDVFIFDANGIHSGNRSEGAIRDTIVIQFTAGRYLWSFDVPSNFKNSLNISDIGKSFIKKNIKINWI